MRDLPERPFPLNRTLQKGQRIGTSETHLRSAHAVPSSSSGKWDGNIE